MRPPLPAAALDPKFCYAAASPGSAAHWHCAAIAPSPLAPVVLQARPVSTLSTQAIPWHNRGFTFGEVAEWLMAADCKSALLRVRWFESSPLHQCLLCAGFV